ncbi:MAG: HhH-GPD-type base excision DNA repair protein, partial [Nitriliruptoraceae bacterium]
RLLSQNPFALLVGMLLDQQIAMEVAFVGPQRIADRLDGPMTPATVAGTDPELLEELFRTKPAVHRYPGSMAKRVHGLATHLIEHYDGDAAAVWEGADDGADLLRRLKALPGYGEQKARILTALLGKQLKVAPPGWEKAAGEYAEEGYRSIADVVDQDTLQRVRESKQAAKAAAKAAKE